MMRKHEKILAAGLALMIGSAALIPSRSVRADGNTPGTGNDAYGDERVYCIGSVSKVYVTTAVMQLADKGLVDIEAPITEYIPNFMMADPRYTKITVRMLMNHTSGIMGTQYGSMELYNDNSMVSNDDFIAAFAGQRLKADPGEYACYCNNGFELLRIIVENVSGMSYTEYVEKYISCNLGISNTGTPFNMFDREDAVPVFNGSLPSEYEYCMAPGSGGIYATASDVAEFGSSFWNGDNRLLSESAKDGMATRWTDSDSGYLDGSGLGWDFVEELSYQEQGVKVIGKGGDINTMHATLLVAPDNEISVSVLTSGGSSMYAQFVAEALLDVALEEQGITIEHETCTDVNIVDKIPDEFKKYEGYYSMASLTGSAIADISFSDDKMTVVNQGLSSKTTSYYRYTDVGGFVEVDEKDYIKPNQVLVFFENGTGGKVYIKGEQMNALPGVGDYVRRTYLGEKMADISVSGETVNAWVARCAAPWVLTSDIYSSTGYDMPVMKIRVSDTMPGYAFFGLSAGSRVVMMTDEDDMTFFQTIPSSSNRDLAEAHANGDGTISLSLGSTYRSVDTLPEFTSDIRTVELKSNEASWYYIGKEMEYVTIIAERPENSAIIVYNKYFEPLYSTHNLDASDSIDLPAEGFIVFLGEDGGTVSITN
jgi:CubicO group peptidase (beta-lactamase class C family)